MTSDSGSVSFPVVGIKSLQAGLKALVALMNQISADSGMSFVVVLPEHLASADELRKRVSLPVVDVTEGVALLPNHVYVVPEDKWAHVLDSRLQLLEPEQTVDTLRKMRERFAKIFRLGPFASFILTETDLRLSDVNESFCTITGYTAKEVIGRTMVDLDLFLGPPGLGELLTMIQEEGSFREQEIILQTKSGALCNVVVSGERIEVDGVTHVLVTFIDVTARRDLERQIQTVSERELSRIGQDLHDTLGQHLVGLTYQARKLAREAASNDNTLHAELETLVEQCEEAVAFTRNFSQMLAPMSVEEPYLEGALSLLCHHVEEMFDLACDFDMETERPIKHEVVANSLYRIAQEAAMNAARHAHASHIHVRLHSGDTSVLLVIEDNGIGISEEDVTSPTGMGIRTMQYRAKLIGAHLTIKPRPEGGTEVRCDVDLDDVRPAD